MNPTAALFVMLAIGVILGGGAMALVGVADRQRQRAVALMEPRLPEGVEDVLGALPQIAIVADPSHNVVRATAGATTSGLITRGGALAQVVQSAAATAWERGDAVETTVVVPRGPFGRAGVQFRLRAKLLPPRFVLVLAEDMTEAIRVEEVRRDFVANVSHELKTPIGAVTLLAEAIGEAADDEEQVRYFARRLLVEGDRLARLTREIIDLSRLQAADTLEEASTVDLAEVIAQAVDRTRTAAEARDISVGVRAPDDLEVWGDAELLVMCLQNLVTNAISYSPAGSYVGVGARRQDDVVEVSVTDRGIGISDDDQQRIFERFYRVDTARSRNTGGTGLGLSIVRHIVENHGGDIRVWSKPGHGSTFTVRLPAAEALRPDAGTEAPVTRPVRIPSVVDPRRTGK
ncbi:MAG: two-component sensor histidine kinase [Microbacteriaceae bacterium]|nr:two-component sensor histidine kinase [Microbacteriaceae bacterium]